MNDQSSDQSFLSGANATFINDLYKDWKENSNSVPKEWDLWFKTNADDQLLDEGPSWAKKNSKVIGAVDTVESVKASIDIIPNIVGKISYLNTEFIEAIQDSQTGLKEVNNLKDYNKENGLTLLELEIDSQEATRIKKLIEDGEWSEEENI